MSTLAAQRTQHREMALRASAQRLGWPEGGLGAAALIGVLYDPQLRVEKVISALASDPTLSAHVIRAANAPCYRVAGQVDSLARAVQLLGLPTIRCVSAAAALSGLLPAAQGAVWDTERFQRHCVATACAAQMLSNTGGCGVDGEAFIAGLLREAGWLLLAHHDPQAVSCYAPPQDADAAQRQAAEKEHFGITLRQCGGWLAETWSLPVWLRDAINPATPMRPALVPYGRTTLPALVALAHGVVEHLGLGLWPAQTTYWNAELATPLRLESQTLHAVAAALRDAMDKVQPS